LYTIRPRRCLYIARACNDEQAKSNERRSMMKNPMLWILVLALGFAWAYALPQQEKDKAEDPSLVKPVLIEKVVPKYPEDAREEKVSGEVVIEAYVGADGKVLEAKAIKDPDPRLAQAALEAFKEWKFKPATVKGKPVKAKMTVTVNFALK
jgi:TonB family protein